MDDYADLIVAQYNETRDHYDLGRANGIWEAITLIENFEDE